MKKLYLGILVGILVFLGCGAAFAATAVSVEINGEQVAFSDSYGYPFIDAHNRTQVPLRITMESCGCAVDWDAAAKAAVVSRDGMTVRVPVGERAIYVDGTKQSIDTAAIIVDSRTYLPIRAVLEAFGAEVDWDSASQTVLISDGAAAQQSQTVDYGFIIGSDAYSSLREQLLEKLPGAPAKINLTIPAGTAEAVIHEINADGQFLQFFNGLKGSYTQSGSFVLLQPEYNESFLAAEYLAGRLTEADEQTKQIAEAAVVVYESLVSAEMSEYQMVRKAHDYIVDHAVYENSGRESERSAAGFFSDGRILCEGYSGTFQLLMDLCGVDCITVCGNASGTDAAIGHAWNMVCLDGSWYHVDVTWDDPVMSDGSQRLRHDYFLKSDTTMREDHEWPEGYPAATHNYS